MNRWKIGALALFAGVVVLGGVVFVQYVGYSNTEVRLRKTIEAQQKNVGVVFDNTWKTIKQLANVADKYKDAFSKIYPDIMKGRYGNARGGALLSFITESNPNFDIQLYGKLSNAIESNRAVFTSEQTKLIDMKREHDTILETIPSSWFLSGRAPVTITVITSSRTEEVMATGKDDDTGL